MVFSTLYSRAFFQKTREMHKIRSSLYKVYPSTHYKLNKSAELSHWNNLTTKHFFRQKNFFSNAKISSRLKHPLNSFSKYVKLDVSHILQIFCYKKHVMTISPQKATEIWNILKEHDIASLKLNCYVIRFIIESDI